MEHIPDRVKIPLTPTGKKAQIEIETIREFSGKRQCSFCRGQLEGTTVISMGGYNSKRQLHRWCWQWILEQSHEYIPDSDALALKLMRKQEMDAKVQEFIDENKERIRQRELERRGLG